MALFGDNPSTDAPATPAEDKKKGKAAVPRPETYGVPPRSVEDVAAEAEAGEREAVAVGPGTATTWTPSKDQLHWAQGIHNIKAAHGPDLTERARELVRRALGELYQEAQGAEPASPLAHDVADALGDTERLNQLGDEQHAVEHRDLNQRGQALYG